MRRSTPWAAIIARHDEEPGFVGACRDALRLITQLEGLRK